MGSIFWQLNDCWPVVSWSSIDYYGRWKALQYYARRFYAPVLVSPHIEDESLAVYVVSDRTQPEQGQLHLRIMDFSGHVIQEISRSVVISPLASKVYLRVPHTELESKGPVDLATVLGAADLTVNEQKVSSNVVFFLPDKQLHLPQVSVNAEIAEAGDGFDVKFSSPVFARDVYVSFGDADVRFSDNYFDILPNEPVRIHVTSPSSVEDLPAADESRFFG